jgi:hypothetical protein
MQYDAAALERLARPKRDASKGLPEPRLLDVPPSEGEKSKKRRA